jgi:hypothetical protein
MHFSRGDFERGVQDVQPDVEWHVAFRLPDLPVDKTIYRLFCRSVVRR